MRFFNLSSKKKISCGNSDVTLPKTCSSEDLAVAQQAAIRRVSAISCPLTADEIAEGMMWTMLTSTPRSTPQNSSEDMVELADYVCRKIQFKPLKPMDQLAAMSPSQQRKIRDQLLSNKLERWLMSKKFSTVNDFRRVHPCTPLHAAVLDNDDHMIALLLWAGADPDQEDAKDRTPLDYVRLLDAKDSHHRVLRLLTKMTKKKINNAQIDIFLERHNFSDIDSPLIIPKFCRRTIISYPLHTAVKEGCFDIVHNLVLAGADIRCTDHKNRTPLELARKCNKKGSHIRMIRLLRAVQKHEFNAISTQDFSI